MSQITIENRPIQPASYTQKTLLQGSNITLKQAGEIVKRIGEAASLSSDGKGVIGCWRWTEPQRPGQMRYNTQPPRAELFDSLKPEFIPGSALAFIPNGAPYVTAIYNSFVLKEAIPTPKGWTPRTTLLDANGRPISETSAAGQTVNFATGKTTAAQAAPAQWQGNGNGYQDQEAIWQPGMQTLDGIGQDYAEQWQGMQNGNGYQNGGFAPVQTVAPAVVAAIPYLLKGALWIGGLTAAYFAARSLLRYIYKIVYSGGKALYKKAAAGVDAALKSGLLLPGIVIGALLLGASAAQ